MPLMPPSAIRTGTDVSGVSRRRWIRVALLRMGSVLAAGDVHASYWQYITFATTEDVIRSEMDKICLSISIR